jgi:hypothetical protein
VGSHEWALVIRAFTEGTLKITKTAVTSETKGLPTSQPPKACFRCDDYQAITVAKQKGAYPRSRATVPGNS